METAGERRDILRQVMICHGMLPLPHIPPGCSGYASPFLLFRISVLHYGYGFKNEKPASGKTGFSFTKCYGSVSAVIPVPCGFERVVPHVFRIVARHVFGSDGIGADVRDFIVPLRKQEFITPKRDTPV